MPSCSHLNQIHDVKPHSKGCEECLKMGDTWVHLRLCLTCGHVGCCDSSKNKHATKHFHSTKHPLVKSLEPGEDWAWCYIDDVCLAELIMNQADWPALPFAEWEKTCDTLHMWTQIIGKTRMALAPLENHWWNVPLYVTPRGLTTSAIPCASGTLEIEFDLVAHQLWMRASSGCLHSMRLYPRSVADFYAEYMAALRMLGIELKIYRVPVEFDDTTPFDQDQHHASYDTEYVERFRRVLIHSDRIFKQFRTRFLGKCSPVHFFWGSFDLAVTRFSGRRAPQKDGVDAMQREAYSHEVTSCGWWPGNRMFPQPAFYAYSAPVPPGLDAEPVRPAAAYWDRQLGEFILKYEDARTAPSPEQDILDFCQSSYEAGAKRAHWDRVNLERPT